MSLADDYYSRVVDGNDPVENLILLYCELFSQERSLPIKQMFDRFVQIYGAKRTFYALISTGSKFREIPKGDPRRIKNYLNAVLLSDLKEDTFGDAMLGSLDLSKLISKNTRMLEKKKKRLKFREFGDEDEQP